MSQSRGFRSSLKQYMVPVARIPKQSQAIHHVPVGRTPKQSHAEGSHTTVRSFLSRLVEGQAYVFPDSHLSVTWCEAHVSTAHTVVCTLGAPMPISLLYVEDTASLAPDLTQSLPSLHCTTRRTTCFQPATTRARHKLKQYWRVAGRISAHKSAVSPVRPGSVCPSSAIMSVCPIRPGNKNSVLAHLLLSLFLFSLGTVHFVQ